MDSRNYSQFTKSNNADFDGKYFLIAEIEGTLQGSIAGLIDVAKISNPNGHFIWVRIWFKKSDPNCWGFQLVDTPEPFKILKKLSWYTKGDKPVLYPSQESLELYDAISGTFFDELLNLAKGIIEIKGDGHTDAMGGRQGVSNRMEISPEPRRSGVVVPQVSAPIERKPNQRAPPINGAKKS
jgi:hypothetical protein